MRGFAVFTATLLVLAICCTSVTAWEFRMKGEMELRYRYISRTGPRDLFGDAEYQQLYGTPGPLYRSSIGLAGPNSRYVQVEGYSAKGSDAAYAQQRLWVYPEIKVNKAISIRGIFALQGNLNGTYARQYSPESSDLPSRPYYVGQSENWATNPHYSGWTMIDSRDIVAGVGMAVPVALAAWARITTPWGYLVFGRRPAGFGMGWVLHEEDVYARSLALIIPYGPLTFAFSQYLHDSGEDTDPNNEINIFHQYVPLSPVTWNFALPGATDKNKVIDWNQAAAVVYRSGNLDLGFMARIIRWSNVHSLRQLGAPRLTIRDDAVVPSIGLAYDNVTGELSSIFLNKTLPSGAPIYGDMFFLLGISYLKYFQGGFFLNAEHDFELIEVRRTGGRPISGFPQAWAIEGGFVAGPLKVSLAHFYRSGHDRRRGRFDPSVLIGFPWNEYDKWNWFLTAWGGGGHPIEPYNFLIGLYGAGNNSYNAAGNCTFTDFLAYCARVDYAVAANLNLFASIIHAERASNTGTFMPYTGRATGTSLIERDFALCPNTAMQRRNTPDNDLGMEFDVGMSWKLLENLEFKFLFAYWQPGNWFKWNYRDWALGEGINIDGVTGLNPGRTIDPLIAIQTGLLINF
jgi:hypothetical protein